MALPTPATMQTAASSAISILIASAFAPKQNAATKIGAIKNNFQQRARRDVGRDIGIYQTHCSPSRLSARGCGIPLSGNPSKNWPDPWKAVSRLGDAPSSSESPKALLLSKRLGLLFESAPAACHLRGERLWREMSVRGKMDRQVASVCGTRYCEGCMDCREQIPARGGHS